MSHIEIPEIIIPGKRLGRHTPVRDAAFIARIIPPTVPVTDVTWLRHTPAFDQGQIGSCTGNAAAGCLDTDPLFNPAHVYEEADAVNFYSQATHFNGTGNFYPPNDTGSSGPASAQALEQDKLISSYTHTIDLETTLGGLMSGPGSLGVPWMTSFDTPLPTGECALTAGATVRGGHEIEAFRVDTENQRVWIWNSWGPTFGINGSFWFSYATLTALFAQSADCTFFTKVT